MPLLAWRGGATRTLPLACPARDAWTGDARLPCPARQDLPPALRQDEEERDAVSAPEDRPRSRCSARIRAALGVDARTARREAAVARPAQTHPRGTIPVARLSGWHGERMALFSRDAHQARRRCDAASPTPKEAVSAIASYLGADNLPPSLAHGDRRRTRRAALEGGLGHRARASDRPSRRDRAALSRAVVGAAETGTLVPRLGRRQSDDARLPSRDPHGPDRRRRYRRLLRGGVGPACGRSMGQARCPAASI